MEFPKPMSKVMTLKDYVMIFKEDLGFLPYKAKELWQEYETISQEVQEGLLDKRSRLEKEMDKTSEEFDVTWHFINLFSYFDQKRRMAEIRVELTNVMNAISILKRIDDPTAGISDDVVEQAREYPVSDLYEGKLRQQGKRATGVCPKHKEDSPSFVIYADNTFHCFGCGFHGLNAIDYLMQIKGISFKDAVKQLAA